MASYLHELPFYVLDDDDYHSTILHCIQESNSINYAKFQNLKFNIFDTNVDSDTIFLITLMIPTITVYYIRTLHLVCRITVIIMKIDDCESISAV